MEPYFIAQICLFAGNFAPRSTVYCAGQLLSIAENEALFSLIGTTYGGDGQNTFAVPDFRGRIPVGTGQGPGLSSFVIGQRAGTNNTTLLTQQMPSHTHPATGGIGVSSEAGITANPSNAIVSASATNLYTSADNANGSFSGSTASIQPVGGNQPYANMMPYLGINFIIATEGIYPSRN